MHSGGRNSGQSAGSTPRGGGPNTNSGATVRSKLAAPLSTQTAGTRRTVHGGAGDGGTDAAWKQTGRLLGKHNPPSRLVQPTVASSLRASSNRQTAKQKFERAGHEKPRSVVPLTKDTDTEVRKPTKQRVMSQAAKQAARDRLWPSKPAGVGLNSNFRKNRQPVPEDTNLLPDVEEETESKAPKSQELLETGVQTNESEILDHKLILGEVKMVCPSAQLVDQIDRERLELKEERERQSSRRFAAHEQQEELHLDELKEFSFRNAVTKRAPKKPPTYQYARYDNQYQNVFKSMDDFFSRVQNSMPKSESVTTIQERIKRKEEELLRLFDNVELNE
ncbi:uncharacterized protein LOC6734387 [Drosophila simulans]|uniref:GD25726 n=1 Tax=Drosophila simulans TaxID=7240 RepID=B4QEW6_DROSI|nr:uncharacterized protein LOC6734387 [Drosophila simulans]EDX06993.1 GD25726 [Drosophila simulans]KMY93650.1 uncharacterized protein Dsimw501_GD25726 [Drosophila simulans]